MRRVAAACLILGATASAASGALAQSQPETQTFKAWTVRCEQPEGAPAEICRMLQETRQASGEAAMVVMVGKFGPGQTLGAIIFLPLGVSLVPGISLRIDDNTPMARPYYRCTDQPLGCEVHVPIDETLLSQMKAGAVGSVALTDGARRKGVFEFSLAGFSAALQGLN